MTTPNPSSYTLRFKCQKTTVFLYASPSTTLKSLKSDLFEYLSENAQNIDAPAPSSPAEIVLGVPKDPADLARGFDVLEEQMVTVQDAGFKDGGVVGYSIDEEEGFDVQVPRDEYDDSQMEA